MLEWRIWEPERTGRVEKQDGQNIFCSAHLRPAKNLNTRGYLKLLSIETKYATVMIYPV